MDDKGTVKRVNTIVAVLAALIEKNRKEFGEWRRLSLARARPDFQTGNPTVGSGGAFGGHDRRKRLVNGQVLDQSKACAKAGRRGGKADPKFGTRVGERG